MKTIGRFNYRLYLYMWLCLGAVFNGAYAQSYTPVAISGYTQDVIAEAGNDATTVTSTVIDATAHIMYSKNFASLHGLLGGIVDNGTIVYSNYTWQMAPFAGSNAWYLSNGGIVANSAASGILALNTPASYADLSLLLFSTEGDNNISVQVNFTDGSVFNAGTGLVYDWYDRPGAVYTSFGRIARVAAPPFTSDGVPQANGHFYKMDIAIPCASQSKQVQSVTIGFVSGTLSGRVLVLALAGVGYTPLVITPTITNATCSNSNGSIALSVSGSSSYYSYTWNTSPGQYSSTATGLAAGNYTCTVADNNGCQTTWQGTVGTVALAVINATASPAAICPGQSSTLSASATGPAVSEYTWTPGSQTGSSISVSPAATTSYTVTGQDANGCTVTATASVTVNAVPVASFTATPDTICQGSTETVTFTGNAGSSATYNWNGFAGATVQSGSGAGPYTLIFNNPGVFTLQLQVTDACPSAIASKQVVVSERPSPDFTVNPVPICSGDTVSVTFTGTEAATATASWNWGGGTVKSGSGFGPYTVRYNNTAIIKLTVKNGACTVSAPSKSVTVIPNPLAAFTAPPGSCVPAQIQFTNQSENATSYVWTFGDGSSSTATNPLHPYPAVGSYTVTLAVSNNGMCFDTLTMTNFINVDTPPTVGFTSVPDTGTLVEVHLAKFVFTNTSQSASAYLWKFGDGDSSSQTDPVHQYEAPGNYTVTLYAMNGGCEDSISHQYYTVIPDKILHVPNAFSPNGDGINDLWEIDGLKPYPDCTVTVFNRWGQALYKSVGYQHPWDGTYKGKPVPVATYYYIITLPGKKMYNGWVVVLK